MFSPKAQKLMRYPQNIGEMKGADGIGTAGNPRESTFMKMWIKINEIQGSKSKVQSLNPAEARNPKLANRNLIIEDIKFKIFGCLPNAAAGSVTTTLAKGKPLEEALKINENQILTELGGLPPDKKHCAGLAVACLRSAIKDALKSRSK